VSIKNRAVKEMLAKSDEPRRFSRFLAMLQRLASWAFREAA
jgi:hypothetical protein